MNCQQICKISGKKT